MHAFIVRPFGTKQGIDFERVEQDLLAPALKELNFSGKTTQEFMEQGNIRTDMFEQLLIADLVIADVSIHNANAFYELGIRHAFRDRHTFLIKSQGDEVPFDIKTDRYFCYDAQHPADSLPTLLEALRKTLNSSKQDSPIFQLLPTLTPTDPDEVVIVPPDFREDVEQAMAAKSTANLQMLATEVKGFAWTKAGLRLIGQAQFALEDWPGAKVTWQDIRSYDELDIEANSKLGTIYQKAGDLTRSDQALARVLNHRHLQQAHRAELYALQGSNSKTRWKHDWESIEDIQTKQQEALCSPHLQESLKFYNQGFTEDRNHYYSGLNALAMVTILITLAEKHADIWSDDFEDEEDAAIALKQLTILKKELIVSVRLAIKSKLFRLEREQQHDIWTEISMADWIFLTARKPRRVGRAYKKALVHPQDFAVSSARNQLLFYQSLGLFQANVEEALRNIPSSSLSQSHMEQVPRVLVFTGHRVDHPNRSQPRFPKESEEKARAMIKHAVCQAKEQANAENIPLLGISGGANGGDILFHEVCQELEIESHLYLVIPQQAYCAASVADGGSEWVERFNQLCRDRPSKIFLNNPEEELPRWLRSKTGYSIWQRSNLWMIYNALTISQEDIILIALWNGSPGDGPGGTEHMVELAKSRGCQFIHLNTQSLIESLS